MYAGYLYTGRHIQAKMYTANAVHEEVARKGGFRMVHGVSIEAVATGFLRSMT